MTRYEIRVRGRLTAPWADRFDGLTLAPGPDRTTVITGPVADQAALHALLRALGDLGLPLLSMTEVQPDRGPSPHQTNDHTRTGD